MQLRHIVRTRPVAGAVTVGVRRRRRVDRLPLAEAVRPDHAGRQESVRSGVHVSGHGGKEDLRDLISIVNPEHIIPAHGSTTQLTPMIELARELGYKSGKECHLRQDGQKLKL